MDKIQTIDSILFVLKYLSVISYQLFYFEGKSIKNENNSYTVWNIIRIISDSVLPSFPSFLTLKGIHFHFHFWKQKMGVFSNKIDREQLNPGDHIYSWRQAYIYAHHGIFFLFFFYFKFFIFFMFYFLGICLLFLFSL